MIPKLICWLFGHILTDEVYVSGSGFDILTRTVWNDRCPRCGKKIPKRSIEEIIKENNG